LYNLIKGKNSFFIFQFDLSAADHQFDEKELGEIIAHEEKHVRSSIPGTLYSWNWSALVYG
jgi:hypothetical protein